MSGKKFMGWFLLTIILTGVGISAWIKHGYDTRPKIDVQKDKSRSQLESTQQPTSEADAPSESAAGSKD